MFDACYTLEKFLRETDGSLDAARRLRRAPLPLLDTKLLAQTFLDAYAAAARCARRGAPARKTTSQTPYRRWTRPWGRCTRRSRSARCPHDGQGERGCRRRAGAAEAGRRPSRPRAQARGWGAALSASGNVQKRPRRGRLAALATVCLIGSSSPRASSATPSRWSLGASLGSVRRRARRNRRSRTRLGTTRS